MTAKQSTTRFEFGDRVRHRKRPEWGVGSVIRSEQTTIEGRPAQRLAVRFPNAGVKTLSTVHAEIERVTADTPPTPLTNGHQQLADWNRVEESEWLAPMARRKIDEVMTRVSDEARDPFSSLRDRLGFTLQLYRFDRSGRGLVDWAVAQSGLEDPLSRFTRQELEQLFDRWSSEREVQLRKLLQEARSEANLVTELLRSAPPSARSAVQRSSAQR